jgi:ribonuclease-3
VNGDPGFLARFGAFLRKRSLDARTHGIVGRLESIFDTRIDDIPLYLKALRHRSILVEHNLHNSESYEQLEFLGDAVLDLIVADLLFERYPKEDEGFMTQMRSKIVRAETLARLANGLGIHELIEVGDRVRDQGIQSSVNVMSDILEALIGALYRDRGYAVAFAFVKRAILHELDLTHIEAERSNHKSMLLEYAQSRRLGIPVYRIADVDGPDHLRMYTIDVLVGEHVMGTGIGKSKKKAEQNAAEQALAAFGKTTNP